jgi:hypothetical protein
MLTFYIRKPTNGSPMSGCNWYISITKKPGVEYNVNEKYLWFDMTLRSSCYNDGKYGGWYRTREDARRAVREFKTIKWKVSAKIGQNIGDSGPLSMEKAFKKFDYLTSGVVPKVIHVTLIHQTRRKDFGKWAFFKNWKTSEKFVDYRRNHDRVEA